MRLTLGTLKSLFRVHPVCPLRVTASSSKLRASKAEHLLLFQEKPSVLTAQYRPSHTKLLSRMDAVETQQTGSMPVCKYAQAKHSQGQSSSQL